MVFYKLTAAGHQALSAAEREGWRSVSGEDDVDEIFVEAVHRPSSCLVRALPLLRWFRSPASVVLRSLSLSLSLSETV